MTTYPSSTERWMVQRRLMTQMSQYMFVQSVFSLRIPQPRKITFDRSTGNLVLLDLPLGIALSCRGTVSWGTASCSLLLGFS